MAAKINTALLIDDEEIDQRIYLRVLERSELVANVEAFSYATDALEYLKTQSEPVDVIFLDINLPRMNGFEFLEAASQEIGERFAKVIIVMLTTSVNPVDRERAARYEAVKEFINKPLTVNHVKEVAEILRAA